MVATKLYIVTPFKLFAVVSGNTVGHLHAPPVVFVYRSRFIACLPEGTIPPQ